MTFISRCRRLLGVLVSSAFFRLPSGPFIARLKDSLLTKSTAVTYGRSSPSVHLTRLSGFLFRTLPIRCLIVLKTLLQVY